MKSFLKISLVITIISFTLTSCFTSLYIPNSHNVPLFREKNEVRIATALHAAPDAFVTIYGFEIQSAYAFSNHGALMCNLFTSGNTSDEESLKGGLFEIGGGYFNSLTPHWRYEAYGGMGLGWLNHKDGAWNQPAGGFRLFAQPSFGYTSKGFDAALTFRMCGVHYNSLNIDPDERDYEYKEVMNGAPVFWIAEPGIMLRFGWEHVKFQYQLNAAFALNRLYLPHSNATTSLGIIFLIKPRKPAAGLK